ncbi:MAG: V-type ATP synthase subunit D [Candidatus Aminicenantes bacterium]|nr:V-type ATP synthase subunit D [Candidatus Aminicenantes bacterium]
MKLNVNPNRMELLRLRRRLVLAERGHKLLKDKLEELMRRFLDLMRELREVQSRVEATFRKVLQAFALARAGGKREELEEYIREGKLLLNVWEDKVFNLVIPRFEIRESTLPDVDLLNTDSEMDVGIKKFSEVLEDLVEVARLWKAVEMLSYEIEATRRRVNALEHILIPNIKETIVYISSRLDEMERSYQVQLMRVKEIVREH